jgi:hypothetical protein
MDKIIDALINQNLIGWAVAILLVAYVFKKNDEREKRLIAQNEEREGKYQDTIKILQDTLKEAVEIILL